MKDFLGNELNIGDEVVFVRLNYRCLQKGTISKMTAKTIWIFHLPRKIETKQTPDQVIKILKI